MGYESPNFKTLPDHLRVKGVRKKNLSVREMKAKGFRESERFTGGEVQAALKHLRRNNHPDSNGMVAECFVYGSPELHEHLRRVFDLVYRGRSCRGKGGKTNNLFNVVTNR